MNNIIWKQLKEFNRYEVSNTGLVRRIKTGRIIKPFITSNRVRYKLRGEEGRRKIFFAHRLVMMTFLDKNIDGVEIYHINRNPQDNRLENLRLSDRVSNMSNTSRADRRREKIDKIIELHRKGLTTEEIYQATKNTP